MTELNRKDVISNEYQKLLTMMNTKKQING